ncbi:RNA 2',3'-cyclic phosphodiesterase [Lysobacter sp. TAF61]|uniref:RNA 2',3'-cyclic phosphodiesterase n=1 Tax=Lysobacter sp. TAF61 TaxID=3233072 RepID=UPI003F9B5AE1
MQSQSHRLFFALWPGDDLRHAIDLTSVRLEREFTPGGRRLDAARFHLTLQFLGDFLPVPEAPAPEALIDNARAAAAQVIALPFELTLDCAGSFRGSRVWWLGTGTPAPGLHHLWQVLGDALEQHGVPTRSAAGFSPHLTIQRNARRHLAETMPVAPLNWTVRDFVLVDSQSCHPYRIIGRWPLQA